MATIEEMRRWNYETAWKFFLGENRPSDTDVKNYFSILKGVKTEDLRDKMSFEKLVRELKSTQYFILIDGASCSGKTTLAMRLRKAINAEVLDIDILCMEFIQRGWGLFITEKNAMDATDQYLLSNLEKIVAQKAATGKTVILVGCYIGIVERAIVIKTLGKYFKRRVSLFCLEKSFASVIEMAKNRLKNFNDSTTPVDINNLRIQYLNSRANVEAENGKYLALGMDLSYIVDTKFSNWLLVN